MEKTTQDLFGIPLFDWESWDEVEIGRLQFYNVDFHFDSMKKFNNMCVELDISGEIRICDDEGIDVWKGFACEIPDFLQEVNRKWGAK